MSQAKNEQEREDIVIEADNTIQGIVINSLASQVHKNALEKGFWDASTNMGEANACSDRAWRGFRGAKERP